MTPLEPSLKFMPRVVRENCTEAVNHSTTERGCYAEGGGGGGQEGWLRTQTIFHFFLVFASLDHAHVLVADEPAFDIPLCQHGLADSADSAGSADLAGSAGSAGAIGKK